MQKMIRITSCVTAACALSFGSLAQTEAAHAEPTWQISAYSSADRGASSLVKALCNNYLWNDKNPRDCHGSYAVYDFSTGATRGTLVFHVETDTGSADQLWDAVSRGYAATQDWCSSNSFTCSIVTSVGVSIVLGWLA
jgi:hypothetical protein